MSKDDFDFNHELNAALDRAAQRSTKGSPEVVVETPTDKRFLFLKKETIDAKEAVVKQANQVTFKDLTGIDYPPAEGKFYTIYNPEDWPEQVRDLIPPVDPEFSLEAEYAFMVLECIERNKTGFAFGPPGTGKTATPEQVCARLNYPFVFISGMGGTDPSDYVGTQWVSDGSMEWKDAMASYAVRHGAFLLYDEPFKSSAQTNMCFQSLTDDRRTLKLYGHPDPVQGNLKAHEAFRFFQADNVRGHGDQMDKFSAEVQDQSTLNRVDLMIHVPYPEHSKEVALLKKLYPGATEFLIDKVVRLAGLLRNGWEDDEISLPFSIRNTKSLVAATIEYGDPAFAFKITYLNGVKDPDERAAVRKAWDAVGWDGAQDIF
jgi:cobaltochelatase CobS